jgi:D-3-phosphoglycerate dehydrogenase
MDGSVMSRPKVLVTPRSFGKTDPEAWAKLEAAGFEIVRNPTGSILGESELSGLLADCEGVVIGVDPLTAAVLAQAPKLRAIAKYGVGVDNIDLAACEARGIKVSRTVGANAQAVADFAFALMLAVARQVVPIDRRCRQADWSKLTTIDVYGKTLGLLGLGAIGRGVAERAQGFGMTVLAHDVYWDEAYASRQGIVRATPAQIYAEADFISLHLPLLPETQNLIGAAELSQMKPTAVLVNTARGGLIDEAALLQALQKRQIYGAGMDAFSQEPPADPAWYALDNLVIGSHAAASTVGATEQMGRMAADNLVRDLA